MRPRTERVCQICGRTWLASQSAVQITRQHVIDVVKGRKWSDVTADLRNGGTNV